MYQTLPATIRQMLPTLSNKQKIVATWFLEHPDEAALMTSTQIAHACRVGEATVIRFANSMGYDRFPKLQQELRTALRHRLLQASRLENGLQTEGSSPFKQIANSMRMDARSIERTISGLQEEELDAVVNALIHATEVFVIGTRSAQGLACYFGHSLGWIRDHVWILDSSASPHFDHLAGAGPDSVALAISLPPYPAMTVELLKTARARGAATVSVTDVLTSPLAALSTWCLPVHNELTTYADNAAPALSLLTGLLGLVGSRTEHAAARLEQMQQFWNSNGIYYKQP